MASCLPYEPMQQMLLPEALQDWLPRGTCPTSSAIRWTAWSCNASRHKAMSYSHMLKTGAELKAQIAASLNKAHSADEAEKNEPELDIPAEIARRQERLNAIAKPGLNWSNASAMAISSAVAATTMTADTRATWSYAEKASSSCASTPSAARALAVMAARLQSADGKVAFEESGSPSPQRLGEERLGVPTGLHRVQAEWKLVCLALNLRRMCVMKAA